MGAAHSNGKKIYVNPPVNEDLKKTFVERLEKHNKEMTVNNEIDNEKYNQDKDILKKNISSIFKLIESLTKLKNDNSEKLNNVDYLNKISYLNNPYYNNFVIELSCFNKINKKNEILIFLNSILSISYDNFFSPLFMYINQIISESSINIEKVIIYEKDPCINKLINFLIYLNKYDISSIEYSYSIYQNNGLDNIDFLINTLEDILSNKRDKIIAITINLKNKIKNEVVQDVSSVQPGGKKTKSVNRKEILGKERCIYKKTGDRKEYVKYKGNLITVKDYKMIMKAKNVIK